jgi:hypothetical protein
MRGEPGLPLKSGGVSDQRSACFDIWLHWSNAVRAIVRCRAAGASSGVLVLMNRFRQSRALAFVQPVPVSAATTDPEIIIYRFPGVKDDLGTQVATVFHCTNFSGVTETIRFVTRNFEEACSKITLFPSFTLGPGRQSRTPLLPMVMILIWQRAIFLRALRQLPPPRRTSSARR